MSINLKEVRGRGPGKEEIQSFQLARWAPLLRSAIINAILLSQKERVEAFEGGARSASSRLKNNCQKGLIKLLVVCMYNVILSKVEYNVICHTYEYSVCIM